MPKPGEQNGQIQEQKPLVTELHESVQHEETIREHLTSLQTWDLQEGQSLKERRTQHNEQVLRQQQHENEILLSRMQQLQPAEATETAPGTPVQVQAPHELSYKERREQKRQDKEARKFSEDGDHVSFKMQRDLSQLAQGRKNSMTPDVIADADKYEVDERVLRSYCVGYKKDKKGNPATPEDRARMERDGSFLQDYLSKDIERRKPYLKDMTREILDVNITPEMLSVEYLENHSDEMKQLSDHLVYFQNIMKDPVNAEYFAGLPQLELELLNAKLDAYGATVGTMLVTAMATKGVNCDNASYYKNHEYAASAQNLLPPSMQFFTQGCQTLAEKETEIAERHVEEMAAKERVTLMQQAESMKQQSEHMQGLEGLNLTSFVTGYSFDELSKYRAMIESNPAAYAKNKELIDQLYQDFYHTVDSMGDLTLETMAYQGVGDSYMGQDFTARLMKSRVYEHQTELQEKQDVIRNQLTAKADALQFLLRDKDLSAGARLMLEESGHKELIDRLVTEHAIRKAFGGPDGVVAKSNKAFDDGKGENATVQRSSALMALGIRSSTSDAAQADKLLRGTTYIKLPSDIAVYFHTQEDEHVDFLAISTQMQRISTGMGGFVTGGGVDAINMGMLSMFKSYAASDESVEYLKKMCDTLKDAKVFGGDIGETLQYLTQCLINSYGANYTEVDRQQDSYAGKGAVRKVALESCRTLLTLPALLRATKEEREQLPEATQQLASQYEQFLQELKTKVEQGGENPEQ